MDNLVTNIQGYSIHDGPGIRTVVFLKGCGLACRWCSNPECIAPRPEVGVAPNLCAGCGKCADVCPEGAVLFLKGRPPRLSRARCTGCGACADACPSGALILYGKPMSAGAIFEAVRRDKMFYDASGGGVTVSGGEALLHPRLVGELFALCRAAGINTCIETSGCAPAAALETVLPLTDFVLYDLKLMDPARHRQYTGRPNDLILANAGTVVQSGAAVLFRMPLVPGVNDDARNIADTAAFLHGLWEKAARLELMPYHQLGKGKYDSLDKEYGLPGVAAPGPVQIDAAKNAFEAGGIACSVSS